MPAPQFDAVKEATDAFTLMFKGRNWLLGAPQVAAVFLILIVVFIVIAVATGPQIWREIISNGAQTPVISPGQIVALALSITIGVLLLIAVGMFTYAWTLVAAEPCWLGQDPAWDRGFNRAAEKLVPLAAYVILVGLMVIVSFITIVGPIIIGFLTMYGPAYILFGNRSATAAIGDSFRLASENLAPSLILVLAFIVVDMMGFIANLVLGFIPIIGMFAGLAFQWLFSAYIALAIVRFYDILSESAGAPPFPIVPETNV